jgi:hypothetical protein
MSPKRMRDLLDRFPALRSPCDLDLLLFVYRHPRAVLPGERLALYVGHDNAEVAKSLDTLIAAGILTRVQGPTPSVRMYLLSSAGTPGGWIDALLRMASTRQGRLAMLAVLAERQRAPESPATDSAELRVERSAPRRTTRVRGALEGRYA